ncbi:Glycoside hydrolase, 38 vacuolar alpha mannosidase [Modicella reniformis]|uniref:Alpha-mannosidase n=1 Tax=Modicella reniformis TaxID=1440133 RepID=A0A9P6MJB8_9FUNG|nr:Glycoside hydrolase, 38 vacuolar alpha mannosidase [Modicella reniformis]
MATLTAQPRFIRSITLDRATKFSSAEYFQDVNLYSQLYRKRTADTIQLAVHSVPNLERISFDKAVKLHFEPTTTGTSYGPSWSTHWFKVKITIPIDWAGEQVELLWDSNSEAMVWSTDGVPRQGLTGDKGNDRRIEYPLVKNAKGGETIDLFIEMACNGMFGTGKNGQINPPDENRQFLLAQVEIVVPNKAAWQLFYDMQVILGMANELAEDTARAQEALYTCNRVIDHFNRNDLDNALQTCLQISHEFLSKKAAPGVHRVTAVGNWPYAETRRKTARSWSTQLRLLEEYPEYVFVCPQAQQLEWLSQDYPKLFKEIQAAAQEGRFQAIGSTWIEMDCNIPSGEAFCRQFLYGQRFYEKCFGARSNIFWLPDTFGYSAQLPQILKQSGAKYFFTQKLSWNNINKTDEHPRIDPVQKQFPNTTFTWVGLDGTKVLTHMAPCETYTAQANVSDIVHSVQRNRDIAFSNQSLMPYGNGDGGGGPQRAMLERIRRMKDIDGLAKCEMGGADAFFESIEKQARGLQEWKGELYFELHRGTYTTQAPIKKYNRKLEFLLREVEIVSTICLALKRELNYPKDELDILWKDLLLNQFHDVLPGSSIELANIDARAIYRKIETKAKKLLEDSLDCLHPTSQQTGEVRYVAFNSLGWPRSEIIEVPAHAGDQLQQYSAGKNTGYAKVDSGSFGFSDTSVSEEEKKTVQSSTSEQDFILENHFVSAKFNQQGHLISFYDKVEGRDLIPKGQAGNKMKFFEDQPLYWDAWDVEIYHLNTGRDAGTSKARMGEVGPLRATLIVKHALSENSTAVQTIVLTATSPRLDFHMEVEWHENRMMLKTEFIWDIHSDVATYDSQFGVVQRPTTYNTSHDYARFEVCGHKFADLSEHGYGVALLNDCKFGYSCHGNTMRLSLLRAPKSPDVNSDMGHHEFSFAVYPHKGTFHESNVVRESYQFNVPMIVKSISQNAVQDYSVLSSVFGIEGSKNVVLDTIKRAEDSDHIILRVYEAFGGRARFRLKSALDIQSVHRCNILEDDGVVVEYNMNERSTDWIVLHAFEIMTLKLKLK